MTNYLFGVAAALAVGLFVVELLRRGILREKFAALWLLVSGFLLLIAVFPPVLLQAAHWLGFQVPANLLFFLAAVLLLVISVQLSYEISRLDSRTRRLAEEVALLRDEVEKLRRER